MNETIYGLPLWFVMILLVLLLVFLGYLIYRAFKEGREISIYPPRIGPKPPDILGGPDKKQKPGSSLPINKMAIGLYYSHIRGLQSETFCVDVDSKMYEKMQCHFDTLWNRHSVKGVYQENRVVCIISGPSLRFIDIRALKKIAGLV